MESFGSCVREEVLWVEAFDSVIEAQTVINDWKDIYGHQRPHSSHGWRTPAAFAATVTEGAQHNRPVDVSSPAWDRLIEIAKQVKAGG